MELISTRSQNRKEISIKDQIKKFGINSLYGFNTIILIGMGRKLGVFDYLYEKVNSMLNRDEISTVHFTPRELSENLKLDEKYLDAWLHLGLECGLFEVDNSKKKSLKTSPHVYNLLINHDHRSYIGGTLGAFYRIATIQDTMFKNFKTGEAMNLLEFPEDMSKDLQERSKRFGMLIERLFAKYFEVFCKKLDKQSKILEVGCGFGYNLETWANKFKKAQFVGLEVDPIGVAYAKNLIDQNNWNERIKILEISINDFTHAVNDKFDLIILNQVLHEMDPNENFRRSVFSDLYLLLKDDGILLVGESMIPDIFSPKKKFQLFDITHKFFEAGSAHFYNEETFKKLVESTPFTKVDFIKESGTYFWVVRK